MGVGGREEEGHGGGGGGHGGTQEEGCLDLHGWVVCLVVGWWGAGVGGREAEGGLLLLSACVWKERRGGQEVNVMHGVDRWQGRAWH